MCAVSALNPQRFRGFGPSCPQLLDKLCADKSKMRFKTMKHPHSPTACAGAKTALTTVAHSSGDRRDTRHVSPGVGVTETPLYLHTSQESMGSISLSSFSGLNRLYKLSADAVAPQVCMSAQIYGLSRLQTILKTQMPSQRLKKKRKRTTSDGHPPPTGKKKEEKEGKR